MGEETNRQKFIRLANARVNKALHALRLVGNLSNRSNYTWTDEDAQKIIRALDAEVKVLKRQFSASDEGDAGEFRIEL